MGRSHPTTKVVGFPAPSRKESGGLRVQPTFEAYEAAKKDWLPHFRAYQSAITFEKGDDRLTVADRRRITAALMQPQVLAMGMATFRSQPDVAARFWTGIASGQVTPETQDAVWYGYELLTDAKSFANVAGTVRALADVWNASVLGIKIASRPRVAREIMGYAPHQIPIHLAGTPYDGIEERPYTPFAAPIVPSQEGKPTISPDSNWTVKPSEGKPMPRFIAEAKIAEEAARKREAEKKKLLGEMNEFAQIGKNIPEALLARAQEMGVKPPKVKRPRGRPRKEQTAEVAESPKRRGRPKKSAS